METFSFIRNGNGMIAATYSGANSGKYPANQIVPFHTFGGVFPFEDYVLVVLNGASYEIKVGDTLSLDAITQTYETIEDLSLLLGETTVFHRPIGGNAGIPIGVIDEPFGFATLGAGVTGGEGGTVHLITDITGMIDHLGDDTAKILFFSGEIVGDGTGQTNEYLSIGSNKTIIGLPGARITNIPLRIYGKTNIIVRNMRFRDVQAGTIDGDCLGIKNGSTNIWIHHNEFSADRSHNSNWEYYDGLVDVTQESNNVTLSYNIFSDTNKACAVGSLAIENIGKNRVTVAYNLFRNCTERSVRGSICTVHMFNNYIVNSRSIPAENSGNDGHGTMSTEGGVIRTDYNYYQNCVAPVEDNLSGSNPGLIANVESNFFDENCGENNLTQTPSTWDPEEAELYTYTDILITDVSKVPAYVLENAGANLETIYTGE